MLQVQSSTRFHLPGPLTLRMMLRLVSSMNSTLTWVTPPREPVSTWSVIVSSAFSAFSRTGAAEDSGDLDKLNRNFSRVHVGNLSVLLFLNVVEVAREREGRGRCDRS